MKRLIVASLVLCFLLGWLANAFMNYEQEIEQPPIAAAQPLPLRQNVELASPHDWIKEEDIHVLPDKVIIDISKPQWAKFTNTNSMDPFLDETSHAIEIIPKTYRDIHIGDIISYETTLAKEPVIHRVVEIGNDGEWYAITKGDNNPTKDPEKVRFENVKRILVAIIY